MVRLGYFFNNNITVILIQGLMFIVYPLLGHLADVYLNKYHTLKCGLVIIVIGGIILVLVLLIAITHFHIEIDKEGGYMIVCFESPLVLACLKLIPMVGWTKFEQEQLIEAFTSKTNQFHPLLLLGQNVGGLVLFFAYYHGYCA